MNGPRVATYEGEVWCSTPYIEAFVIDLKRAIPGRERRWDADLKLWHVERRHADVLVELLERHYRYWTQVEAAELGLGSSHRRPAPVPALADPYRVLCVTPEAPPELVDLAYRYWAKRIHPDRGGNHESMIAINLAYEAIAKVKI
jgi:hypothetical protein